MILAPGANLRELTSRRAEDDASGMATKPIARRVDLHKGKVSAVEFKWMNDAGDDCELYTYDYESKGEADYVVEQFTKWAFYLEAWGVEFTDAWIGDSIRCARRDRMLWRWLNAA